MAIVITHPVKGVYLGHCIGCGFWSAPLAATSRHAVTFPDEASARKHIKSWKRDNDPDAFGFAHVETDKGYVRLESLQINSGLARQ